MNGDENLILQYSSNKRILNLPSLSEEQWCDFRKDYESGLTLKSISEKYICDPRTVKRCLLLNKNSSELGRQRAPTILSPYLSMINSLWQELDKNSGICHNSRAITDIICKAGYTGTERTVRNYIRSQYYITSDKKNN